MAYIGHTLTFREDVKGWVSFKSWIQETGISLSNDYFTFQDGKLWEHHSEQVARLNFYGIPRDCSFTTILNQSPEIVKKFKTLEYEGTQGKVTEFTGYLDSQNNPHSLDVGLPHYSLQDKKGWYVDNIITDLQDGYVPEFIEKEGKWFNYVRGNNIQTNINGLVINHLDPAEFSFQGLGYVDGSTVTTGVFGCMDANYVEYDPLATIDDGSCSTIVVFGCTDPAADNPCTNGCNTDDGSCNYTGCNSPFFTNYNPIHNVACSGTVTIGNQSYPGCCQQPVRVGCVNPYAQNFSSLVNVPCGSSNSTQGCIPNPNGILDTTFAPAGETWCQAPQEFWNWYSSGDYLNTTWDNANIVGFNACCDNYIGGCTDPNASNYDPTANTNDGTCVYEGCTDPAACNYDPVATIDNGSCLTVYGCLDNTLGPSGTSLDCSYDQNAECNDPLMCSGNYAGCTDSSAPNYDPNAACDDGSCQLAGCDTAGAVNYNTNATSNDGSCEFCQDVSNFTATTNPDPNYSHNEITLSWDIDEGSGSANVDSFLIEQNDGSGWVGVMNVIWQAETWNFTLANSSFLTVTSQPGGVSTISCAIDTGLNPNTSYNFRVSTLCLNTTQPTSNNTADFFYGSAVNTGTTSSPIWTFSALATATTTVQNYWGCTEPSACNYNAINTIDNGLCECQTCSSYGCTDPTATNYVNATIPCNTTGCSFGIWDPINEVYDNSGYDGGTSDNYCCTYQIYGCTGAINGGGFHADDAGWNGDINGDRRTPTPIPANEIGHHPCEYSVWASMAGSYGPNPNFPSSDSRTWPTIGNIPVHITSTNSDCKKHSWSAGDPNNQSTKAGYKATNFNPLATDPEIGVGYYSDGCIYQEGCTDDGSANVYIQSGGTNIPAAAFAQTSDRHDYTTGPLTPGAAAVNYSRFAEIDDGSCMPTIYGCKDQWGSTSDTQFQLNWNRGRGRQNPGINDWVGHEWVDTPVPGFVTNFNPEKQAIDSNIVASYDAALGDQPPRIATGNELYLDPNTHDQAQCITTIQGCAYETDASGGANSPYNITFSGQTSQTFLHQYGGWVKFGLFTNGTTPVIEWAAQTDAQAPGGDGGIDNYRTWAPGITGAGGATIDGNPVPCAGANPSNDCAEPPSSSDSKVAFSATAGTQGPWVHTYGTQFGAYNFYGETASGLLAWTAGSSSMYNPLGAIGLDGNGDAATDPSAVNTGSVDRVDIAFHPWMPTNMDACCFNAGCLHPGALNFDLIGYEQPCKYDHITGQWSNCDAGYATVSGWSLSNTNVEYRKGGGGKSCAFCDGTPASRYWRTVTMSSGESDPEIRDGTLGLNNAVSSQEWEQTYYDKNPDSNPLHYCCVFPGEVGCTDPTADNYIGGSVYEVTITNVNGTHLDGSNFPQCVYGGTGA